MPCLKEGISPIGAGFSKKLKTILSLAGRILLVASHHEMGGASMIARELVYRLHPTF